MLKDNLKLAANVFAVFLVVLFAAISFRVYQDAELARRAQMSKDVQAALAKGVDPIVIRCAYADENDQICLIRAANRSGANVEVRELAVK